MCEPRLVFGVTSDWLKKWCENFEPITESSNVKPKQFANYFSHSIENRFIMIMMMILLLLLLLLLSIILADYFVHFAEI